MTSDQSQRLIWLWMLAAAALTLLVYTLFYLDDWHFDQRVYVGGSGVVALFIISVLVMLYVDYRGTKAGIAAGHEALADDAEGVSTAHGRAYRQMQGLTMTVIGMRLTVVGLAALELCEQLVFNSQLFFDQRSPSVLLTIPLFIIAGGYLLEPWWRVKATTAFGLTTATRRDVAEEGIVMTAHFWWMAAYWGLLYTLYTLLIALLTPRFIFGALSLSLSAVTSTLIATAAGIVLIYFYNRRTAQRFLTSADRNLRDQSTVKERRSQLEQTTTKRQFYSMRQRFFAWQPLFKMMQSRNPVFGMEARRLKAGSNLLSLRGLTFRVARRVILIAGIATGLLILHQYRGLSYSISQYPQYYTGTNYFLNIFQILTSVFAFMAAALGLLSIVGEVFLDFACIHAGMNSINRDMVAGRWDLLRVTSLTEAQILYAKHAITGLRAWRGLIWIVTMRVLSVLIFIGLATVRPPYSGSRSGLEQLWIGFHDEPLLASVIAFTVLWFVLIYLLEVFWRHQAMTALGLAVSAGRNTTHAILTALGSVLGVWISQAFIMYLLGLITFQSARWLSDLMRSIAPDRYNLQERVYMVGLMTACFITGWVIFGYYSLLGRFNLNHLRHRVFKA
jgi:hypothetical protein